jgi:hypothetical protein
MQKPFVCFLLLLTCLAASHAQVSVRDTPEWKSVAGVVGAQLKESGADKNLVDAAYASDGTYASVSRVGLAPRTGGDDVRSFVAGIIQAAEKRGFEAKGSEVRNDAPYPRTVYVLQGGDPVGSKRVIIYYVCDKVAAFVFTLVGDQHLEPSSEIVRRYAARVVFADASALSATLPASEIERAWDTGQENGRAMIVIGFLLVVTVAVGVWILRSRHRKNSQNDV